MRNILILILWSLSTFLPVTSVAVSSADLSVVVTLDPVTFDLVAGTQAYESSVANEYTSTPSGSLVPYIEGAPPTEIGPLIDANVAYLQSQGLDTVYVFPIEGTGQLLANSPTLLSLVHAGFNYDDAQTSKKRYVLVADLLDEIVTAAHSRGMKVQVNIESLAHIINRSASSGIGGEAGTLALADDLPAPTIAQVNAYIDELLAYGIDALGTEAFPPDYDQAIATQLANASIAYWRAGADIGDVWLGYHYSLYPTVRSDTNTYNYLHTMDSLLGQTNGGVHARARAVGKPALLTVGAYNPLPCDLTLVESDLYSVSRAEFIDAEVPALPDGTLVENCTTAFWRNLILFGVLGQAPSGILIATDMTPSIAAGLDPTTVPGILARIDDHPFTPATKPVANIILDRPAYDEDLDGIAAQDFIDGMMLSILPLVSDALEAAGFQTVLTYDAPYTAGTPALTYILTAGGNEGTYGGDEGSGPPQYTRAMDFRSTLLSLLDPGTHPAPVFIHPVVGIPSGTGDGESWPGWGAIRSQFGLPNRFAYVNPQSTSDTNYHTSLIFSALVDAAGEAAVPPGQLYIVPSSGSLNSATVQLEPWFDVFDIGQFANLVQPDSGMDNIDIARITASGPLLLPQGPGAGATLLETTAPYLLNDGNGRYLWLVNQLNEEAFVWLVANEAAVAAGLTPPLIAPAKAHINGGERFMALAYDRTTVQFSMPVPDGSTVRVRVYDQKGDRVTDENPVYSGSLSYVLEKRSLLVAEPGSSSGESGDGGQDTDNDGVTDAQDAFPLDATESLDTDHDGMGNNADTDDDNDGMPDAFESSNGLDPLVADASDDADGDGATNLQEFQTGTDPSDAASIDGCYNSNAVATDDASSSLGNGKNLYFANPGSNASQQTFLRFINANSVDTSVEVYGIDDGGTRSRKGALSFTLAAGAAKQITAQDIENGNTDKQISENLCDGQGKWQFRIRSDNPIEVVSLIRTPDGFLTSLNDVVPRSGNDSLVYFANPASNSNQQTFLRIVNESGSTGTVSITGIDDAGVVSAGSVVFSLASYESKQITSQDLEVGNPGKGLTGSLDDGAGKWRLSVSSSLDLKVMSLIRTPDGFLTNLSSVVEKKPSGEFVIYYGNPATEVDRVTFLRIINTSSQDGTVTISGTDDNGDSAPEGDVILSLGAGQSRQMTAVDLETGNSSKGLIGMLGDGQGRWRLSVSADVDIQVMSLIRTPDGFLTNLSRTVPVAAGVNDVLVFNPGSNTNQRSSLRLVNDSAQPGTVVVSATDDSGAVAPGGVVTFNIGANSGMLITSQDLENGNTALGLAGSLGNGTGKWHLRLSSDVDLQVQSLLDTPTGFLTNLSRAAE